MTYAHTSPVSASAVGAAPSRGKRLWAWLWPGATAVGAIPALDGLRAIAVLLVMSFHSYHPLPGAVHYTSLLDALSFGHTGVQLFFVLSGFLLFLPYARALLGLQAFPSTKNFYTRRILRVGPAYWINVLIILFLAKVSVRRLESVFAHLFFLHNVFYDSHALLNGVLWTMAVEVQFYALLPLLAWIAFKLARKIPWYLAIGLIVAVCEACSMICDRLVTYNIWTNIPYVSTSLINSTSSVYWLGVFAFGMGCSVLYVYLKNVRKLTPRGTHAVRILGSLAFCAGLGMVIAISTQPHLASQLIFKELSFGWYYGLMMIGALLGYGVIRWPFELPALRFLGHISYSLYLWHLMILNIIEPHLAMITDHAQHTLVSFLIDASISIPFAYLSFQLTERPFFSLRRNARDKTRAEKAVANIAAVEPLAPSLAGVVVGAAAVVSASVVGPAQGWNVENPTVSGGRFPQPGHIVSGYRLERELGQSPQGVSFLARQVTHELVTWRAALTPATAVVKFLWPPAGLRDERARAAFRETVMRQSLNLQTAFGMLIPSAADAGAAQYIAWEGASEDPYLIRAYVDGFSLADLRARSAGGIPLTEIASYVTQVAAALDYAHSHGVAHGALTLENILISRSGEMLVSDFGLHSMLRPGGRFSYGPAQAGRARYTPPDHLGIRDLTPAADIYALGVALYALVCGQFPFAGESVARTDRARWNASIPLPRTLRADVSPPMEALLMRALTSGGAGSKSRLFTRAGDLAEAFNAEVEAAGGFVTRRGIPSESLARSLFRLATTNEVAAVARVAPPSAPPERLPQPVTPVDTGATALAETSKPPRANPTGAPAVAESALLQDTVKTPRAARAYPSGSPAPAPSGGAPER